MSSIVQYAPEVKLLLCCAYAYLDSNNAEQVKELIQDGINWEYLLEIAQKQKLKPLLCWQIPKICPEFVPTEILVTLETYFNENAQRNELLTQELFRLVNLFEQEGVSVLPYKGPILALSTHGNLGLRHWWDLDILVDQPSLKQAKDLLIDQGYELKKQLPWEESFINKKTRFAIDLHQSLTSHYFPLKYDFQHFWQCSELKTINDTKVHCFSPEHLLIILCVQVVKDTWEKKIRFIKICDVAELIASREAWDWERVLEEAHFLGCQRVLFLGLFLTDHFLKMTLPETMTKKIQMDIVVKGYADRFRQRIFPQPKGNLTQKPAWTDWLTRQEERLALSLPRFIS